MIERMSERRKCPFEFQSHEKKSNLLLSVTPSSVLHSDVDSELKPLYCLLKPAWCRIFWPLGGCSHTDTLSPYVWCKQLPVCTFSRHAATLALIWSHVSSNPTHVSPVFTLLSAPFCSPPTSEGNIWLFIAPLCSPARCQLCLSAV